MLNKQQSDGREEKAKRGTKSIRNRFGRFIKKTATVEEAISAIHTNGRPVRILPCPASALSTSKGGDSA